MSTRIIGPFNRVEGDLEVHLEIENERVQSAQVSASLYRGFEHILLGRPAFDAITITPRICGICSVSQSVVTAAALSDALGVRPSTNGQLGINLVHAAENLADHLTHFYLFFMPDFARPAYADKPWFAKTQRRFQAQAGLGAKELLAARARLLNITGILAGKWPHTLAVQPGGLTRSLDEGGKMRLLSVLADVRAFLQETLYGLSLEEIAGLENRAALDKVLDTAIDIGSDLGLFAALARDLDLESLGAAYSRFLSFGAYHFQDENLFPAGMMVAGEVRELDPGAFREDLQSSWYAGGPSHPADGVTQPFIEREGAYTWCKAPRVNGQPAEVGAVARQLVAGQPLIRDMVGAGPANVFARIIARLVESARIVINMEYWARRIEPKAPVSTDEKPADEGVGVGLAEAARGSLGHWVRIEKGRIQNYQIITPTTWNFSPRDGAGVPGPVEYALEGTPVAHSDPNAVAVQHVVRSFDPCMACTVH